MGYILFCSSVLTQSDLSKPDHVCIKDHWIVIVAHTNQLTHCLTVGSNSLFPSLHSDLNTESKGEGFFENQPGLIWVGLFSHSTTK